MPNVFISHRTSDLHLAEKLATELAQAGHQVWIDSAQVSVGDSIVGEIEKGLRGADYIILCYSKDGVDSPWTSREWQSALGRQLTAGRTKVLPIVLTGGGAIPAVLADIKYADLDADWHSGLAALLKAIR